MRDCAQNWLFTQKSGQSPGQGHNLGIGYQCTQIDEGEIKRWRLQ